MCCLAGRELIKQVMVLCLIHAALQETEDIFFYETVQLRITSPQNLTEQYIS